LAQVGLNLFALRLQSLPPSQRFSEPIINAMPGFLQHITSTGYGYVDPYVEKARNIVPLLDTTVQRIEPYFPPVIQAADKYIDVVHDTAGRQVAVLQVKRSALHSKVSDMQVATANRVQQLFGGVRASALFLVERSDGLVDQFLPPDEAEKKVIKEKRGTYVSLIPRAFGIPFKIPIRVTRIVVGKAGGLSNSVVTCLVQGGTVISERVARVTAPGMAILSLRKASAAQRLQVAWHSLVDAKAFIVLQVGGKFYVFASKLRLHEAKRWTLAKVEGMKEAGDAGKERAMQGAYSLTTRAMGEQRAIVIFDKLGVQVPAASLEDRAKLLIGSAEDEARKLFKGA